MSAHIETCVLCPRLCRHACPVATGTGREAAVPTQIADVVLAWRRGEVGAALAREAVGLCVDCGRCQEACHLHQPLPDLLAAARVELGPIVPVETIGVIEGEGELVAVEAGRPFAALLAKVVSQPVGRLITSDALGVAGRGGPRWQEHLDRIVVRLAGKVAVTDHGGVARVLEASGTRWVWLHDQVAGLGALQPSCLGGALACCGGAEPLRSTHPEDAARLAHRWMRDGQSAVADGRCASHLRAQGFLVEDAIDRLAARAERT